ncbi:MAG: hypothetical protein KAR20_07070, partial [Candidatus Heimdallarchaeota archaeon]|nr:hypothetical protein [Candidatus Heimdallarchaeota archaeon]
MKKRNTAIRRIVKAIESEHTEEGELLLWETTAKAVQKGSGIDLETIQYVFKLLKQLKLIQHRDWSVTSRTYIVGLKYPDSNRIWIPAVIALPHLKELSISPQFLHRKLRQENILLQLDVDLFKAGLFVYLGDDLKGPPYSSMLEKLKACLKDMTFRQNTIIRLISRNQDKIAGNVALTKVFFDIYESISCKVFSSFEYFIGNKGLNLPKKGRISEMYVSLNYYIKTIGKNKIIRNTILRSIVNSDALVNGNSSRDKIDIHFFNQSETPVEDSSQQQPVPNRKE